MPEQLGRYEILDKIGQGGFAIVYRARDAQLQREVALKELRPALLQDRTGTEEFIREARTIARLDHPRIVTIHDIVELSERLFIVMRLVDGSSLDKLLAERGPLSWSQAVEIIKSIAEALDYAHSHGILHRDLKPANILLDSRHGPLLSDFGLARLFNETSLSASSTIVGTPHYIAPEVWNNQGATPQSDLYALGCILYELLTGQKLFEGQSPPAVMMAHFNPLTLPDTWPEDVPAGVTEVLESALAKDSAERYTSAAEMVEILTSLGQGPTSLVEQSPHTVVNRKSEIVNRYNLPAQTTPFIGRQTELAELELLLSEPATRLVTILGPGGMGKTRLALEVAMAQLPNYRHGVHFVSLAPLSDVDNIVPTILQAVDYPLQEDGRSPEQQLLDYFREKQMLLVLDNFEHLLALSASSSPQPGEDLTAFPPFGEMRKGADLVTTILQAASQLKIIVTSRQRLRLSGETVYNLAGLDVPQGDTLETTPVDKAWTEASAVQLFLQGAQRVRTDFKLLPDDRPAIARICDLVEGLPLGILLAASWVEMLWPNEIAEELSQSIDFLASDLHDLPARQRSIRAVFDYSWQQLTETEQQVFQQLSIFRGGFSREAAQEVIEASLRTLMALVNKSLVQRTPEGRYVTHELLRQYAAERLTERVEELRDRHSAYYCAFLHQCEADLKGPRQEAAISEIQVDYENIRLAWEWAGEKGQVERLAQALESLGEFLHVKGRIQEGAHLTQTTIQKLQMSASKIDTFVVAQLLIWQAAFSRFLGQTDKAQLLLKQSLDSLDSPDLVGQDTRQVNASALKNMGIIALNQDFEKARYLFEQSLILYEAINDQLNIAIVKGRLGWVAWETGHYREAKQLTETSLTIQRTMGVFSDSVNSIAVLGWIALTQGQIDKAEALAREGLAIRRKTNKSVGLAVSFRNLAAVLIYAGKTAEAQLVLEEAQTIFAELGIRSDLVFTNVLLAAVATQVGNYDEAQTLCKLGYTLAQEVSDRAGAGHALLWLGQISMAHGEYGQAYQLFQEGRVVFREVGQKDQEGVALSLLGFAACRLNRKIEAIQTLSGGLESALKLGAFHPIIFAWPGIVLLLADAGHQERAIELWALALEYPFVANSRWFEDVIGQTIADVAATLPPDVVAVAETRGRELDLWQAAGRLLAEFENQEDYDEPDETSNNQIEGVS